MLPYGYPIRPFADLMGPFGLEVRHSDQTLLASIRTGVVDASDKAVIVVLDLLAWFAKQRNVKVGSQAKWGTTSLWILMSWMLETDESSVGR